MERFPIATVCMIIVTFFFIVMYMVTSDIFFYNDFNLKQSFESMGNESITNPWYHNTFNNSSTEQKMFYQYGMIGSVIMCPIIAFIEIISYRRRSE